jgi:hypothetical protein
MAAMTLEERIEKLELELKRTKRQKRLTRGVAAVVIILAAVVVYPQGKVAAQSNIPDEIRTGRIVVVDGNKKPCAVIAVGKEGPGLAPYDENGETRSILCIDKDGSRLSMYDEDGKPRAGLSVGKEGPKLTLFDKKGNEHWSTPSTK